MQQQNDLTLRDYIKETLVVVFIFSAIAFIISAVIPPMYKSNASILIVQKDSNGLDAYKESKSAEFAGKMLMEVMRSNTFMEAVTQASSKAREIYSAETDPQKRLELWRDNNPLDQVVNTGVLNLSSYAKDRNASKEVLTSTIDILQNQGKNFHGNTLLDIKIINKPYTLEKPAYPNLWLNTLIGAVLGVIFMVLGTTLWGTKMLFLKSRKDPAQVRDFVRKDNFNLKAPVETEQPLHSRFSADKKIYSDENYFTEFQKRFTNLADMGEPEVASLEKKAVLQPVEEKVEPKVEKEVQPKAEQKTEKDFPAPRIAPKSTVTFGSLEQEVAKEDELINQEMNLAEPKVSAPAEPKPTEVNENEIPVFMSETPEIKSESKKAQAPANLPFADEAEAVSPVAEQKPAEKAQESPVVQDPTEQEIKERLNKLLKGEL